MNRKHFAWLAVAAATLAVARLIRPEVMPPAATLASRPPALAAAARGSEPATASAAVPPSQATTATASSIPYGLSAVQWAQLQEALAGHPQRDAELARIGSYLAYMNTAQRFRELREHTQGNGPGEEWKALARTLEAGLTQHLDQGELSAAEALQLRSAALEVLEPDRAVRQHTLVQWQQSQARARMQAQPVDARESHFAQQQALLVAQWSAQAPEHRDPHALETQLEALRQSIFTPPR